MRKLAVGTAAAGAITVVMTVGASSTGVAQETWPNWVVFEPDPVVAGETVTVTPDLSCPMPESEGGTLEWEIADVTGQPDPTLEIIDSGSADLAPDGSWSFDTVAPVPEDGHGYGVWSARCTSADGERVDFYTPTEFNFAESTPPTTAPGEESPTTTVPEGESPTTTVWPSGGGEDLSPDDAEDPDTATPAAPAVTGTPSLTG